MNGECAASVLQLVQLFLPLRDDQRKAFPRSDFDRVRKELTDRFGGVTAFARAPAVGLWEDEDGDVQQDDVVLFEVMADHIDREWWRTYGDQLKLRFRQEEILIRATAVERL